MIDPNDVTKFDRTPDELLEFWLFCLFVRGKNANVQAQKLDQFRHRMGGVSLIRSASDDSIDFHLRSVRAGQYNTLVPAISQTLAKLKADPDFLKTASAVALESLPGVGPKTSRFFILHTRPKARVAVLDTHILNYLNERDGENIPVSHRPVPATLNWKIVFYFTRITMGLTPLRLIWQFGAQVENHIR